MAAAADAAASLAKVRVLYTVSHTASSAARATGTVRGARALLRAIKVMIRIAPHPASCAARATSRCAASVPSSVVAPPTGSGLAPGPRPRPALSRCSAASVVTSAPRAFSPAGPSSARQVAAPPPDGPIRGARYRTRAASAAEAIGHREAASRANWRVCSAANSAA
eukprot:1194653-Prorocentrum_minimum.AAC.6